MRRFDVFNGDADGICALHQIRLATPCEAELVTGSKRDIALLDRVDAQAGDAVTVLDVSLDRNRDPLLALLDRGVVVDYFDHHYAGEIPRHPGLRAWIDTSPAVCTSILVDRHLGGRHRAWAIAAAYGDSLPAAATALARSCGLDVEQMSRLRELGECVNYNAYGNGESDAFMPPAALYRALRPYADPFEFIAAEPLLQALSEGRRRDLDAAGQLRPAVTLAGGTLYILPGAAWARRVQGDLANRLAAGAPDRAHALLVPDDQGGYRVSVRAPLRHPRGADRLCRSFAGGGRESAAGINQLPGDALDAFVTAFGAAFPSVGQLGP